jgi:hypothetical protein
MEAQLIMDRGIFVFVFQNKRYPIVIKYLLEKERTDIFFPDIKDTDQVKVILCGNELHFKSNIFQFKFTISQNDLTSRSGLKTIYALEETTKQRLRIEELEIKYGKGHTLADLENFASSERQKNNKTREDLIEEGKKQKTKNTEEKQLLLDVLN